MAESVNSDEFDAKSCDTCPGICMADLLFASEAKMGEDCSTSASGSYYLTTNWEPPYAKGSDD